MHLVGVGGHEALEDRAGQRRFAVGVGVVALDDRGELAVVAGDDQAATGAEAAGGDGRVARP